jgi:hypothetical protein
LYEPIDAQEALRYYKLSIATKEGLTGGGNMQAIQTMMTRDEERRKEIEAAKMTYQNQLKQYGLIGGLVMVLIIAFILYLNNRRKQKANALLHQQKEEIQSHPIATHPIRKDGKPGRTHCRHCARNSEPLELRQQFFGS